jgi:hypothetical protein
MVWPRAAKHGYVLVRQGDFDEYVEDAISPLTDMSNVRQLVSELSQHCVKLPLPVPAVRCYASCIMQLRVMLELPANLLQQGNLLLAYKRSVAEAFWGVLPYA